MDANPVCQEGDLEGKTQVLLNMSCFEVNDNDGGGGGHLQGDQVFKDVDALVVLWVLLDVGVCKERLKRTRTGGQLLD